MNISIDDLASSFSASHVSQEAMDIATLQVLLRYPSIHADMLTSLSVPARKSDLLPLSEPVGRSLRLAPQ